MPIDLCNRLLAGQLSPAEFSHEAHIQAAWECLQPPSPAAIEPFAAAIKALATRAGAPGRYHATITGAFLTLVAAHSEAGQKFAHFQHNNGWLFRGDCLAEFYTRPRLESSVARDWFLTPDRKPLPHCPIALAGVEQPKRTQEPDNWGTS
ncbi:MAG: hypothetical protein AB8B96_07790 [Lysobacterales bacterium]